MTAHRNIPLQRKLGAAAIELRITEIALLSRNTFPAVSWGKKTPGDGYKNRLDVDIAGRHAAVQFTNRELRRHARVLRVRKLDLRMYSVLQGLLDT